MESRDGMRREDHSDLRRCRWCLRAPVPLHRAARQCRRLRVPPRRGGTRLISRRAVRRLGTLVIEGLADNDTIDTERCMLWVTVAARYSARLMMFFSGIALLPTPFARA